MKRRFPGLKQCLKMMRSRDPQMQEDGFHFLAPRAVEFIPELIEVFEAETDRGLRCWLLELIGSAKSPAAFDFLVCQLHAEPRLRHWAIWGLKELDTKEARSILWQIESEQSQK